MWRWPDRPIVAASIPALDALAAGIGDPAVRNRGTHRRRRSPMPIRPPTIPRPCWRWVPPSSPTERKIAADDFFHRLVRHRAGSHGEIITAVRFPVPLACGYAKFRSPASRYAIVGVFVARFADAVRVGVTGAGPVVFRVPEMERALQGTFTPGALAA